MDTLEEIREKRAGLEKLKSSAANRDEIFLIEKSIALLKESERELISGMNGRITDNMEKSGQKLKEMASEIRKKVTKMNRMSAVADTVEKILEYTDSLFKTIRKFY